ncbi:anthranilate synthase component II [Bellilinea sp.]|uniref:anthranilate synthase component II n=1 Tax=Bellilinea sp. TaxID=2838785 RepID=UPI003A0FBA32
MMLLILDNYDSFTYNLAQLFGELGEQVQVVRSDQVSLADVLDLHPQRIVISPGPGGPQDAGISLEVIRRLGGVIPILGVCLGHQCIGAVFGGQVVRAPRLMHGKTSQIFHNGEDLFAGLPNPFEATRYHSLMVAEPLPEALIPTAFSEAGELMALRHRSLPIFGVQFHPESILTLAGRQILDNFLKLTVNQPVYS